MQITDILAQMGGLQSVASELGVSESQAAAGASALIPAILGGFKQQAQAQPGGIEGLGGLLGKLGGGGLLENVLSAQPTDVSKGNDVLGQIFGSKDVSRTVAQDAATRTGLDTTLLKKMLPMLAMLVAGYMATRSGTPSPQSAGAQPDAGGMGDALGGALGAGGLGGALSGALGGGGLGGLLGGLLGGGGSAAPGHGGAGGLGSLLDMNGDGNALDDIMRMAGKMMR